MTFRITSLLFAFCAVAVAGCAANAPPQAKSLTTQAAADRISQACGLPASTLAVVAGEELRVQPQADAEFESVDCALREISKSPQLKDLSMGFVGNEAVR